jgi:arylsulfatase A-like enzyme
VKLDQLRPETAQVGDSWARALQFPHGRNHVVDLGSANQADAVRISLAQRDPNAAVMVRVLLDGTLLHEQSTSTPEEWVDIRVPIPSDIDYTHHVKVSFDSPARFRLAECTLVPRFQTPPVPPSPPIPNVLLFVIDTLRLDHLSCYGYGRFTSPYLDALAQDGVQFDQLMPPSSWTRPSMASLFTSTYPNVHGANDRPDVMRSGLDSLSGALGEAGYMTWGYVSNVNLLPNWGFGSTFDRYTDVNSMQPEIQEDSQQVDLALKALDYLHGSPWYLYVHAMGPHDPYAPTPPYDRQFQTDPMPDDPEAAARRKVIDLYDGEIAYTDSQLGRLITALKEFDEYDNTLIVVLSDHGEEFWDHGGEKHGHTLYEEQLRVPFVVKFPNQAHAGKRLSGLVEMVDVAPTILDALALPTPEGFQGHSLLPYVDAEAGARSLGYASLHLEEKSMRAVKGGRHKFIRDLVGDTDTWFNLAEDAAERKPLGQPPKEADVLLHHAQRMDAHGASGLHVLVTRGDTDSFTFSGSVTVDGVKDATIRQGGRELPAAVTDTSVVFEVEVAGGADATWNDIAEQDHALLQMDAEGEGSVALEVSIDGEPIAPENIYFGAAMANPKAMDSSTSMTDLAAHTSLFDAARLPRKRAVYVWYVPNVETVDDVLLSEEMIEAMRTLGYVD